MYIICIYLPIIFICIYLHVYANYMYILLYVNIICIYYMYIFTKNLYMYIFTNPSARAGYDTRSISKWSLAGFNSVFPYPRLVASPRLKNLVCPTIYP